VVFRHNSNAGTCTPRRTTHHGQHLHEHHRNERSPHVHRHRSDRGTVLPDFAAPSGAGVASCSTPRRVPGSTCLPGQQPDLWFRRRFPPSWSREDLLRHLPVRTECLAALYPAVSRGACGVARSSSVARESRASGPCRPRKSDRPRRGGLGTTGNQEQRVTRQLHHRHPMIMDRKPEGTSFMCSIKNRHGSDCTKYAGSRGATLGPPAELHRTVAQGRGWAARRQSEPQAATSPDITKQDLVGRVLPFRVVRPGRRAWPKGPRPPGPITARPSRGELS